MIYHVFAAPDVKNQWIGKCVELDIVTVGNSPIHAMEMIVEAVDLVRHDEPYVSILMRLQEDHDDK